MTNTISTTEVTVQELLAAFDGKHVNISYGISINMNRATLESGDYNDSELCMVCVKG